MKKFLLCALLAFFPLEAALPSAPPASFSGRELSDSDLASIRSIARSYPCAMLTFLHLMRDTDVPEHGVLYIDETPSPATIASVLDDFRTGSEGALYLALQVNLYSSARTYTELRWSSEKGAAGTWHLHFSAELKDRTGPPLVPRHVLEQAVEVLLTPDGLHLGGSTQPRRSTSTAIITDL